VHELEHIRRADWIIYLAAQAACILYWFHPLVWLARRRICLEAELACDDAVVESSARTDYAEQLVSLAQQMNRTRAGTVLGMAQRSDLSSRVIAVLNETQLRGPVGLKTAIVSICLALLALLAIAPVRAVVRLKGFAQAQSTKLSPGDRALFEAADAGDVQTVARLINEGANVNSAIHGDGSPLIAAARNGHLSTVRLLLDRGADANMPVPGDGSPLIMAAREGHTEVVSLLLDRGATIDLAVADDENALIQASANGQLEVVKLLVTRGANINTRIWVDKANAEIGEWRTAISMASAAPVEPSYIEALATSMPVNSQIIVWNSKMACSVPWESSA